MHVVFLKGLTDSRLLEVGDITLEGEATFVYPGNLDFDRFSDLPAEYRHVIHLPGKLQPVRINCPPPSLIVNCICDPDHMRNSLQEAFYFIQACQRQTGKSIPAINPPKHVLRTGRDTIYNAFHALPGLTIPRTIRVSPRSAAETLQLAETQGIDFPFLMRTAGVHGGKDLQLVEGFSQIERLERYAYDGRAFYISAFYDLRGADGLFRKCRLVVIDGQVYPRHLVISSHWLIHAESRSELMQEHAHLREEEEAFLQSLPESISSQAQESIRKMYDALELDFFGIDCCIDAAGDLFVFEVNASMRALMQANLDTYPYLRPFVFQVRDKANEMIAARRDTTPQS